MMRFIRVILSIIIRYSPSKRLTDIILWPIASRLFGSYSEIVRIDTHLNMKVYGDMEDMVNKTLLFTSSYMPLAWEPGTARLTKRLAPIVNSVVVAGSHIGYYPLIITSINPNARIYAFEPNPLNMCRLKENIAINGANSINVSDHALGNTIGQEKMYFDFGQSSFVDSSRVHADVGIVQVTTIDNFFQYNNQKPDLIILDAEGFEPYILEGGEKLISYHHPYIIFELNPKVLARTSSSIGAVRDFLLGYGYTLFVIDEGDHGIVYKPDFPVNLVLFDKFDFTGVSFVNVFATIYPENVSKFED